MEIRLGSSTSLGIESMVISTVNPVCQTLGRRDAPIAYVLSRFEAVDAILLIRDMDDQSERREGSGTGAISLLL